LKPSEDEKNSPLGYIDDSRECMSLRRFDSMVNILHRSRKPLATGGSNRG
jgi:hypothetical protein